MAIRDQQIKRFGYLAFALIMMILCWESNRSQAALIDPVIPQESIRVRILANSDSPEDQWVKRKVRDALIDGMNQWVTEPQTIEQAREAVRAHLPEIRLLVGKLLKDNGFQYGFNAELATVPFPEKIYGNRVYPAGDYEALRITLGSGEGQNWWCVLFPPLCFVDAVKVAASAQDSENGVPETIDGTGQNADDNGNEIEVHFFLWDVLKKLFTEVKSVFS